ncbi:hypothetical protein HETIRDRAFT_164032 [Heterobasidion irregulare TC 32-1]|uniref:Uncharacterized protein n=1 Tax=Heterobasidion irregulare (strain TC 32-1) TaxID=747525 RepID=W4JX73_HETIT|nr:uncharacterized protein HETIRDRAFT_164032 [Heterobasidion irregulare TC 32-1]ETW78059.1 hypothetical protein HETIRDRAFT_164032 [Heterobasidion irregulare TC 32-1]
MSSPETEASMAKTYTHMVGMQSAGLAGGDAVKNRKGCAEREGGRSASGTGILRSFASPVLACRLHSSLKPHEFLTGELVEIYIVRAFKTEDVVRKQIASGRFLWYAKHVIVPPVEIYIVCANKSGDVVREQIANGRFLWQAKHVIVPPILDGT